MVTLLIMTNGRGEYLERTLSTLGKLHASFSRVLIHDDSGDNTYRKWLERFKYEIAATDRVGFAKAMISAWQKLKEDANEWVFHLEDDFLFMEDVAVADMIKVMGNNPHLKEIVLLRQPIGSRERKKGGIIASHPERYEDKTDGVHYWVEHRNNFSCNPCVYNKSLVYDYPWPDVPYSERQYGRMLFKDANAKCAYWGKRTDAPRVMHIGDVRVGLNY
ncbi:TPA: hypothetical protein DIV48_00585 [Candidatus Kaiserbacteria bacterium]|nr:MAG: hypothetical protein UY93_C0002G0422 [Parcubacteria group bacterium GW2011_GWA1_56_13]KKW45676.1 MAG: hypothetical protein UY97_C0017G0006 [Parcubacteria group bacterium GW2011_GWB1_57_6]HCR52128.1 hypothetical protein [Candidatus Kaiserbacteria bacterium]